MTVDGPRRIPRRPDTRGQWTIKHVNLTGELRQKVAMAASRQGMPVGGWIADTLSREAARVIRGEPAPDAGPPAIPPQRLDDVERQLAELAEAVAKLQKPSRWRFWR